jgi:hypothetical protein
MGSKRHEFQEVVDRLGLDMGIQPDSVVDLDINNPNQVNRSGADIKVGDITVFEPAQRGSYNIGNREVRFIKDGNQYNIEVRKRPICPSCDTLMGGPDLPNRLMGKCGYCNSRTCEICRTRCDSCDTLRCMHHTTGHGVTGRTLCDNCLEDVLRKEEWERRKEQYKLEQKTYKIKLQHQRELERIRREDERKRKKNEMDHKENVLKQAVEARKAQLQHQRKQREQDLQEQKHRDQHKLEKRKHRDQHELEEKKHVLDERKHELEEKKHQDQHELDSRLQKSQIEETERQLRMEEVETALKLVEKLDRLGDGKMVEEPVGRDNPVIEIESTQA